jgi:HSP20 family protein
MSLEKLLKEMGGLIRFLQQAGDQGLEINRKGRLDEMSPDLAAGIYDFHLRLGTLAGQGIDRQDADPKPAATIPPAQVEPAYDLFDEPREVVIVVQVPGVSASDVHLDAQGQDLVLNAGSGERMYIRRIPLPMVADLTRASVSLTNGVLEIRLPKPV